MIGALVATVAAFSAMTMEATAETRTLDLYNTHTKERLTITFKKNGKYVGSALRELNQFLRDWRRNEPTDMDPRLFDTVWEVYSRSGSRQPIHVVSAYRSLATNNMLRSRSRGVAKHSQHTLGKAMDFFLPDVKVSKLREIGVTMQRGGVGFYPTANNPFVHIDVGSVRAWPRLSRQQLVKLFPDGKTVHLPTDGKPLAGYQEALAELKRNGSVTRPLAVAEENSGGTRKKGLLAMLFGDEEDEGEELSAARPEQSLTAGGPAKAVEAPAPAPAAPPPAPAAPAPTVVAEAPVPPKAPEQQDAPVASLAEATLPAGTAVAVAAAPPPPAPRKRPEVPAEEIVVAAVDPSIRPRPRPDLAVAEDAPVQVAFAEPASPPALAETASPPAPTAPMPVAAAMLAQAPAPATDEPADARMALAEVARDPASGQDLPALGYASPLQPQPALARAPAAIHAARAVAGPSRGVTPPATARPPEAAVADARKADPLAVLTPVALAADLPIYDGGATAWGGDFARLAHPDQLDGEVLFTSPRVVVKAAFDRRPYGPMSAQTFSGVALTRLPLAVFRSAQDFAMR